MAHHLDLLPCVGMSRAERRQERNQRLLMKRAYNAARLKAESEERVLDRILEEDDSNKDGLVSFPEFMSALHAGKLDGLKIRKTRDQN